MLDTYLTQVQRLLQDPNGQLWSQAELTDYINEARNRVAQDSKCLRQLATSFALTAEQESYTPQTFLGAFGPYLVDVLGVTVYWGNARQKLSYLPFSRFDSFYRRYQAYYGMPECFTRLGANNVIFGPSPDQAYVTDWDVAVIPNALESDSTVEQIPVPFQEPVQYYAAYKAKFREQAMGEAGLFQRQYVQMMQWSARSYSTFRVTNPYGWIGRG